jgi:uncharacterized protein YjiS (DUF1127 family)
MHMVQLRFSRESPAPRLPGLDSARAARQARSWASVVARAATLLLIWRERARQRRHLGSLNDYMLRDIGLTRADVLAEGSKPFWRA